MNDTTGLIVAALICLPAFLLAFQKSSWLVDYLFFVVALNRGIRRYVDWWNGSFNPLSLISLTPIIVGGLATLLVLTELNRRPRQFGSTTIQVILYYSGACAMAFVVGFINTGFAAIYALGDYLAPIGLIGFGSLCMDKPKIFDRWSHSVALTAVIVAGYGIYQFYTIPPWDAFWVRAVDFEGYLGELEPTKMTLFSTLNERGPAATYLCSGLILIVLRPGTLWWFRWPAATLVLMAMLLTYTRTSVIQASLACLLFPILNRGAGIVPVAILCMIAAVFGETLLQQLPGAGMAASRVSTIGNLQEDSSFQGRIRLIGQAANKSLSEPLGLGIGSHGLAERISTTETRGGGDTSGYIETLRTFGWIGFVVIVSVLYRIWSCSRLLVKRKISDPNVALFRAWFVSGMAALFSGNWLFAANFFWVLAGYVVARSDRLKTSEWKPKRVEFYPEQDLDTSRGARFGSVTSNTLGKNP